MRHGRTHHPNRQGITGPRQTVEKGLVMANNYVNERHRKKLTVRWLQHNKSVRNSVESAKPVPKVIEDLQSIETGEEQKASEAELVQPEIDSSELTHQLLTKETKHP